MGSGGREHALGWKLAQSPKVGTIYHAPGNGGTGNNVEIEVHEIEKLAQFASEKNCLTVVGPEIPLAAGIVDVFQKKGIAIFGPTQDAARLESSKVWAKNFMKRNGIPTARFEIFDDAAKAKEYVRSVDCSFVVKADGLAAGKGVIVPTFGLWASFHPRACSRPPEPTTKMSTNDFSLFDSYKS